MLISYKPQEIFMHRKNLLDLLETYTPNLYTEQQFKKDIIAFIQKNQNCFERSLEQGHITASAWILNRDASQALLLHHKKLDSWFQLGGHCDGDPDTLAVAIKEAQEESGILGIAPISTQIFDIDIHLIPENNKEQAHYHYDIRFLLQVTSDETIKPNKESKELRWINKSIAELPTQNASVVRMFHKWVNDAFEVM